MRNLKVIMSYRGTAYHGYQIQKNAVGIQNIIEEKLSRITNAPVKINGCSRTDTGVHANEYCFSFQTEHIIPCYNLIRALNCSLPNDISVHSCEDVSLDFHARFDCIAKEYKYLVLSRPTRDPFWTDMALHYIPPIDIDLINRSAQDLIGTHDFTSFCGVANLKDNPIRTIEYIYASQDESLVKFLVKGDGFLYNMVRIIVGTLLYINEGRIAHDAIPQILDGKNRNLAGKTASPYGLYLNKVFY